MSVNIMNCKTSYSITKIVSNGKVCSFAQSLQHNVKPFSNYAEGIGGA